MVVLTFRSFLELETGAVIGFRKGKACCFMGAASGFTGAVTVSCVVPAYRPRVETGFGAAGIGRAALPCRLWDIFWESLCGGPVSGVRSYLVLTLRDSF